MDNTLKNKSHFETDKDPQIKAATISGIDRQDEVYFIVNVVELFEVDLNYPGIINALNKAFEVSKHYVPVDTGLTKRSYTMVKLDNYRVKCFFDPKKILGQMRRGKVVKEYYVKYIAEHASRMNWLSICMKHFYDTLYDEVRKLFKVAVSENKPMKLSLDTAKEFMQELSAEYKSKKEIAQEMRKAEREKKLLLRQQILEKKRLAKLKKEALKKSKEE